MTATDTHAFEKQIEQLVMQHIAACRRAAVDALERAFASAGGVPVIAPKIAKGVNVRRAPEEVVALGERLYKVVCKKPGEKMSVLAQEIESTPSELQIPASRLKQAGRIRSVGQRQFTRYFPMPESAAKTP